MSADIGKNDPSSITKSKYINQSLKCFRSQYNLRVTTISRWTDVKQEYDEFVEQSREMEIEMDATLDQKQSIIKDLTAKLTMFERENESLKVAISQKHIYTLRFYQHFKKDWLFILICSDFHIISCFCHFLFD